MGKSLRVVLVGLVLSVFHSSSASASYTINPNCFTGTPENSWLYSEILNAGHGGSSTYYPTNVFELSGANDWGYVTYDPNGYDPVNKVNPHWWYGSGGDTMQIFTTYVMSTVDQVVPIGIGGDDGHSLFFDDVFIAGAGFGPAAFGDLTLQANVARKVTLAGYNGPGDWVFGIWSPGQGDWVSPIDNIPNVRLNANGDFSVVPEPTAAFVWGVLGVIGIGVAYRRRRLLCK